MKSLKEFINENHSVDAFNDWLEDVFGYSDLYRYFSDLVPVRVSRSNWEKLAKEAYEHEANGSVIRNAEEAGLDPEGVCYQVFKDSIGF